MKNPYWNGKVPTPVKFGDRTVAGTAKYHRSYPVATVAEMGPRKQSQSGNGVHPRSADTSLPDCG
jgi:hypothetical protein